MPIRSRPVAFSKLSIDNLSAFGSPLAPTTPPPHHNPYALLLLAYLSSQKARENAIGRVKVVCRKIR
jgi:hypothetical protein